MKRDSDEPLRIVIAGGGTGGHLYPAIAVKEAMQVAAKRAEFDFVGTANGLEARVLPQRGERLHLLWVSGLKRGSLLQNLTAAFKLSVSLIQSLSLLRRLRPHLVIGTGGYVMGPVLYIAQRMKIPTLIQEQNSYPGLTTRKLAPRADAVCLAFADAAKRIKAEHIYVMGNPVRRDFREVERSHARQVWGIEASRPTLLVVGGSQGARSVNCVVGESLPEILSSYNLIWQTGAAGVPDSAPADVVERGTAENRLRVKAFIDDMPSAYAAADLAICRAGAMTIAELAICGLPAILIPFPFATDDHQTANAKSLVEGGAATLIADRDLTAPVLMEMIRSILSAPAQLEKMHSSMKRFARPQAADDIAKIALGLVRS